MIDETGYGRMVLLAAKLGTLEFSIGRQNACGERIKPMQLKIAIFFAAAHAVAFADSVVVPNAQATAAGNTPFKIGASASRIQEVIGGGQLSQFTGPVTITALRVRSFPGSGPVNFTLPSYMVTMSTTQAYANTNNGHVLPSATFSDNVGPDATVVYNSALAASSPGCAGPAPCPFDLMFKLTTPFSFDGSKGRLLIDLVASAPTGSFGGALDGEVFPDSSSSNVAIVIGDPTSSAGTLNLGGLVFEIDTAGLSSPSISGVINSADFSTNLAPGAIAQVIGNSLWTAAAGQNCVTTACTGLAVSVGGKPGFVTFASATVLNVQIPYEAAVGASNVMVTLNGAASAPFSINTSATAPTFFTENASAAQPAAVTTTTAGATITYGNPANPNATLAASATGLGATTPATNSGIATNTNPASVVPTLTIGGVSAKVVYAGTVQSTVGYDQVNFTVPTGLQGSQPIVLTSGTKSSSSKVILPIAGITRLVSNGGFGSAGMAAPGQIATVFANGLGKADQTSGFPATMFQGAEVTFNGTPAPLFHLIASAGQQTPPVEQQIDLLVPDELPTSGNVNVQLITSSGSYPNYSLKMAQAVPGLFRIQDPAMPSRFNVIATFPNSAWLALPVSTTTALKLPACGSSISLASYCGQPATFGDTLILWMTGLGIATPNGDPNGKPLATGQIPPADGSVVYETPTLPAVTIGGVPAKVLYSAVAPSYPGDYQVAVQVPMSSVPSGDDVPLTVTMFGNSDTSTISIQPRH
jgi:uncharacterized protein (TIGR03437 family)